MTSHITRPFAAFGRLGSGKPSLPKHHQLYSRLINKGSSCREGRKMRSHDHVSVSRMQPDLRQRLRLRCSPSGRFFLPATPLCDGETHKAEFTTGKAADPPRRSMVFFLANSSESTQGGGKR